MLATMHIALCQENATAERINSIFPVVVPSWQWRCDSGDASLNFNPAFTADRRHALVFDSVPYAENYTVIVVYKPIVAAEASVWKLHYDDGSVRGLTTEHIVSDHILVRYAENTSEIPIINTLRQSAPDSTSPYVRLTVGGDSLFGETKVAEILYFGCRLDNETLRRVQSALAIRYGVTLGPVNYLDGGGDMIWSYADGGQYHHRVTGVGRDSTYNIHQLQSRSEMANPVLTISADSLSEGSFFVCGDNDAPLDFEVNGEIEMLNREWKINRSDNRDNFYTLSFDTRGFPTANDSLVLLVDGHVYFPDSISRGTVTYKYVIFPTDTSQGNRYYNPMYTEYGRSVVEAQIYPNPSTGNYTIEITGADWVKVSIYNTQGILVNTHVGSGQPQYLFNGALPTGNAYYATVTTENGSQTMKLIVK